MSLGKSLVDTCNNLLGLQISIFIQKIKSYKIVIYVMRPGIVTDHIILNTNLMSNQRDFL